MPQYPAGFVPDGFVPDEPARKDEPTWTDRAVSALPYVGGIAGGVAGGGLMSIPLAALGGAGGKGLELAINQWRGKTPYQSEAQNLKSLGMEGAAQGASQAVGMGLGKAVQPVARGIMRAAVNPAKQLVEEFPDVIKTIMQERLPVGGFFNKGSARAGQAIKGSAAATDEVLNTARQAGVTIDPADALASSGQRAARIQQGAPVPQVSLRNIRSLGTQYEQAHPSPISPAHADEIKRFAQAEAEPVFKAERAGQYVPKSSRVKAEFNRDVARDLRAALGNMPERAGRELGKEYSAQTGRTQSLIGAQRALKDAEGRRLGVGLSPYVIGAGTAGLVSAHDPHDVPEAMLLGAAMTRPAILSRLALAASHKAGPQVLSRAALLTMRALQDEDR